MAESATESDRIDELMALPYDLIVRAADGDTIVLCPDLRLYARGTSLEDAMAAMAASRRDFFARYVAVGEPEPLPDPGRAYDAATATLAGSPPVGGRAGATVISTVTTAFTATATVLAVLAVAGMLFAAAAPALGRAAYRMTMAGLAEMSRITPEREREIHATVAAAARKIRPLIAEFAPDTPRTECPR